MTMPTFSPNFNLFWVFYLIRKVRFWECILFYRAMIGHFNVENRINNQMNLFERVQLAPSTGSPFCMTTTTVYMHWFYLSSCCCIWQNIRNTGIGIWLQELVALNSLAANFLVRCTLKFIVRTFPLYFRPFLVVFVG